MQYIYTLYDILNPDLSEMGISTYIDILIDAIESLRLCASSKHSPRVSVWLHFQIQ